MITVTAKFLQGWIATLMWPLARIRCLYRRGPCSNHRALPRNIKLALGLVLTVAVMPALPEIPPVSVFSMSGLLVFVQQILIGAAMGFSCASSSPQLSWQRGHAAGMTMGLGFAMFYDPQTQGQSTAIGQFLVVIAMLIFLAIDGHLMVISTLLASFPAFPLPRSLQG